MGILPDINKVCNAHRDGYSIYCRTPHIAAERGHVECVSLFLKRNRCFEQTYNAIYNDMGRTLKDFGGKAAISIFCQKKTVLAIAVEDCKTRKRWHIHRPVILAVINAWQEACRLEDDIDSYPEFQKEATRLIDDIENPQKDKKKRGNK